MTKRYIVTGARSMKKSENCFNLSLNAVLDGTDSMQVSDGYHTMDELYDHRFTLWIALCKISLMVETDDGESYCHVWRSKLHSDGTSFEGWFVLGFNKKAGEQITYHIPLSRWDETDFAETMERGPEFDGHTSSDVLERVKKF